MKELDGRRKLNDVDFSKPDEEAKDPPTLDPSPRFDYRTKEVRTQKTAGKYQRRKKLNPNAS